MDNKPTADTVVWSVLSLIALLGGTGVLFAVYGRWSQKIGWRSIDAPTISFRSARRGADHSGATGLRAVCLVIALLFLGQ
ncbi:nitric-oxide reductase large subunit, partial [Rhodococcus hoagii]|nr:nitric-oxide reductase large subunit [Prescottella equi]